MLDSCTETLRPSAWTSSELHWMYLNSSRPRRCQDLKAQMVISYLDGSSFFPECFCSVIGFVQVCCGSWFKMFLWSTSWFCSFVSPEMIFLPNLFSFSFFVPFRLFSDQWTWYFLTHCPLFVFCLLQVLKPLSEQYMEDNVRQTVVNSIRASLTEQGSQHTKLKTHWHSSPSSSSPPSPIMSITLLPTRSMCPNYLQFSPDRRKKDMFFSSRLSLKMNGKMAGLPVLFLLWKMPFDVYKARLKCLRSWE